MRENEMLLKRTRLEASILADLAMLAHSTSEDEELVAGILDSLSQVVSSPLLSLAVGDDEGMEHIVQTLPGVDAAWAEEAETALEEWLHTSFAALLRASPQRFNVTNAWFAGFGAEALTGRGCLVVVGAPAPLEVEREEAGLMARLASQIVLVLDRAALHRQVERLDPRDTLTGLANYRRMLDILQYEMRRHRHEDRHFALLLIDVTGLRDINRTYGNQYGDHILIRLADLLCGAVRPIDLVARCGLDEFAVLLPETGEEEAEQVAERLQALVEEFRFAGGTIGLTIGVTQVKPAEHLPAEAALSRAEAALAEAKRQQRGWSALHREGLLVRG